jgi:transcriptional regulator with XRE-family HTH domain
MKETSFPNNIRKYRRIAGYSQKEASFILGFKQTSTVSKWEKGLLLPGIRYIFILSHLYNVLPHKLYPTLWESTKEEINEKVLSLPLKKNANSVEHFYL